MRARIQTKRIYTPTASHDGYRILVDRVWPRGLRKADANLDQWLKDIAPSTDLRKWFGHDPTRFQEFRRRYEAELRNNADAINKLLGFAEQYNTVTLLYAGRDTDHNHAVVLADYLQQYFDS